MCILFVDDESIIVMVADDALRDAGHEVMTARDALAAVKLVRDYPGRFSCLVTDIHMPGEINELDLVEHTRQVYPRLPIVVTTGRPDVVTLEWRKRHQAALLTKPYTPKMLVETVGKLLQAA